MLLLGTIIVWLAFAALLGSSALYVVASARRGAAANPLSGLARALYCLASIAVIGAAVILGTLLVTHRFDSAYVYEHSARAMAPLYWFPSFWAGQEGSFLLWAFWTSILGVVLAFTSGASEKRVMPVFNTVLLFLVGMLLIRSPFLPLDTHGGPVPLEGLGLNPNLENPWMVIHPPTLFLGFSSLAIPFAFALAALFHKDWQGWLRQAIPWALFGFSILGLAMMMGGYWAYEMLGWGGFWGWDPVENGPFVPWMALIAFLHAAQIQRVKGGFAKTTLFFALIPFVAALYETFLTRTGILEKFSVHSFSTLGGNANNVLLWVMLGTMFIALTALVWRGRELRGDLKQLEAPASREFAYFAAVVLLTLCAVISLAGMSAPLLTTLGVQLHITDHVGSVQEDFYNKANYPIAFLLAIGLGLGPHLAWRGRGAANGNRLLWSYALAVLIAMIFTGIARATHAPLSGPRLLPQLLLLTASAFALVSNVLLLGPLLPRRQAPRLPGRIWTAGGTLSHLGVAVMLIGIVCLITFVRKDPDVTLVQGRPVNVLDGTYTMTYAGQSSDYKTDKNNALKFAVASHDGTEKFTAMLPFALRAVEGGQKMIFGHPAIIHHAGGDLYLALKDGPDQWYKKGVFLPKIALGGTKQIGPYTVQLVKYERDPEAAAFVQSTGQMPDLFPVTAVLRVTYLGITSIVTPRYIMHKDNPAEPETPEVKLPGGWLVAFEKMNAGSSDANNPNAGAETELGEFQLREDTGPPLEAFKLEVSTRPMINLVWIGTLLLVAGGLITMRRRILENRAVPLPAEDTEGSGDQSERPAPSHRKRRHTERKPAPALSAASPLSESRIES